MSEEQVHEFKLQSNLDSEEQYGFIKKELFQNQNLPVDNSPLHEQISTNASGSDNENTQKQPEKTEERLKTNKKNIPRKRWDKNLKNLPNNISSYLQNHVPAILTENLKQMPNVQTRENIKKQFKEFLKEHDANNNQLVVLFAYMFMTYKEAKPDQLRKMGAELSFYLARKLAQSRTYDPVERQQFAEKISIIQELVNKYFDGFSNYLDLNFVASICSRLFHGRQKSVINKPLKTLTTLNNRWKQRKQNEQVQEREVSYHFFTESQPSIIQPFFEFSSNYGR